MFIALYTVFLVLASGIVGAFGHALLAEQGYVADFDGALLLTIGLAAGFACVQLAFMSLLQLVSPTRGGAPLLTEAVSHSMALILLPSLLRVSFPISHPAHYAPPFNWIALLMSHPKLEEYQMLVFAGAFLGLHAAIKLVSLFAALHAPPTTRLVALVWGAASLAAGMGAVHQLEAYTDGLVTARETELALLQDVEVDRVYAKARPVLEGSLLRFDLEGNTGKSLLFHFAVPEKESDPPEKIFIAVDINGASNRPYLATVALNPTGWTAFKIPPQQIPADATRCDLIWMREEESSWMTQTRIRPAGYGDSTMLVAGPTHPEQRTPATPRSIVVLMADGMTSGHTNFASYERKTTPELEAWGDRALRALHCVTPAPETPAAFMTLLTGQTPLAHGWLNGATHPLPTDTATLAELLTAKGYICAAFTEGESTAGPQSAASDLVYGNGVERGFHLFDQAYPMVPAVHVDGKALPGQFTAAGSSVTLERARNFIEAHREYPYFVVIRLRELASPRAPAGSDAYNAQASNPRDVDVYDAALQHLDAQLGEFLRWLDQGTPAEHLAVAITGSYGYDFPNGKRGVYLNEPSLRVPLLLRADASASKTLRSPCSMEDIAATLASIAGVSFPGSIPGINLLGTVTSREPISMTGNPLALSLRTRNWRLTWQSGRDPFSKELTGQEEFIEFVSIDDYERGRPQQNNWSKENDLANRFRQRLLDYLQGQKLLQQATAPQAP